MLNRIRKYPDGGVPTGADRDPPIPKFSLRINTLAIIRQGVPVWCRNTISNRISPLFAKYEKNRRQKFFVDVSLTSML
jgi:hypothetical protein